MRILDARTLDDLTQRVSRLLPAGADRLQADLRENLRAVLSGTLARMDLVTREEFEVQSAVLARTREKVERLEAAVARLEEPPPPGEADAEQQD